MTNISLDNIHFYTKSCDKLTSAEISDSSKLFSENYGFYSQYAPEAKAGNRVKLGESYYQKLASTKNYHVSFAYFKEQLVGHAYYLIKAIGDGRASWVIQLVVHKDFRKLSIGKRLLYSVWGFSNDVAWGLATSNPITVKTLESATFRKVSPEVMKDKLSIIKSLASDVIFMNKDFINISNNMSIAFTNFYVDHSEIQDLLNAYGENWELGELPEGHEWLAFTFQDQEIIPLSKEKIDKIVEQSDRIIKEAYSRMEMPAHSWAKHSESEVTQIIEKLSITDKSIKIADFGCGIGRHIKVAYDKGFTNIVGIDFSKSNIEYCKQAYPEILDKFIEGDCRYVSLNQSFDLIICLYDVVGSFSDELENRKILNNIYRHLRPGGILILSVMNMELTNSICKYKVNIYESPLLLFKLKASNIMQSSGDIFNPEHFLIDSSSNLVYRKEMFINENHISAEYLIRDKRYTGEEISALLIKCNFKVNDLSFVQAGNWNVNLSPINKKAKEILVYAQK